MRTQASICIFILFCLTGSGAFGSSSEFSSEDCINCHTGNDTAKSRLNISLEDFKQSVHHKNDMGCTDCHSSITDQSHETKGAPKVDCLQCHDRENHHGISAQAQDRPSCDACHTRHDIREAHDPASSVHVSRQGHTCRSCHADECAAPNLLSILPSFKISTHGKPDFGRQYEKTNCTGCHQGRAAHGETGKINDQNCDTCHLTPDGKSALIGKMHPHADMKKDPVVFMTAVAEAGAIIFLIAAGIGFYFKKPDHHTNVK